MRKNKVVDNEIAEFAEFNKPQDAVYGVFTGIMEGGKSDVALFKTGKGTIGVNVYASLKQAVDLMEKGERYLVEFEGVATSKKKMDYFKFSVYQPEPETEDEKEILNAYYQNGIFNTEDNLQYDAEKNDVPF